jgi:Fe/S biogenesis protein NfuA
VLTLSDRAKEVVHSYLDQSGGELSALRITMVGSPVAPTFELTLVGPSERRDDETDVEVDGLSVLVDGTQLETLEGANVDFVERVNESGFEVKLAPGAGRKSAPSGPLAERVTEVLNSQINPAIASHGGAIELIDVKGTEIFFEMTGGCQGCAMSRMTLRQGVERMVRQAVPEITVIHDVTDHSSGENPFFEGPQV